MAIEDTGLLNSALERANNTALKNQGKTSLEKNQAGISDQEVYNQREAKDLKTDGFSKIEIDTYHNRQSVFPMTDAFDFAQSDLKINNISQDDAIGLTANEIIKKNIDNDVENYKNHYISLDNRNKKFHEINQKILENPVVSQKGMLDALGIKDKIKFIQQDGYDKEMKPFLDNIYYGTVDINKYMTLINQIGFIMSDNVNKINKDGTARGLYMFDKQDNSIEESFEYLKYLTGYASKSFSNKVKSGNANYLNTVQQMKLITAMIKQKIPESILQDALEGNSDAFVSIMKTIYGKNYTKELQDKTLEVLEKSKNPENIDFGDMDLPTFLYRGESWLNNILEDLGFDYGSVSHFHKNLGRMQAGKLSLASHAIDTGGLSVSEYNMMIHELAQLERSFLKLTSDEVTVFTGDFPLYMTAGGVTAAIHKRITHGGKGFLRKYISQQTEQNLLRHAISFSSVSFTDQIIDELINEGYFDDESLSEVLGNPESRNQLLKKMFEILVRPEFWENQGFAAAKGVAMSTAARAMFKRIYPKATDVVKYDKAKIGSKDKTTVEYEKFKFTGLKRTYRESPDAITYGPNRLFRDELPLYQRFPFLGPNVSNFTGQILGLSSADYWTGVIQGQPINFKDAAAKNLAFLFTVNVLTKGGRGLYNRMRRKNTYDPEYGDPAHPENRYIEFGFEPPSAKAKEAYINMSKRDLKIKEIHERKIKVNEKVINLPESKVVDTKIIDDIEIAEIEVNPTTIFGENPIMLVDLVSNLKAPDTEAYQINKNPDGSTTIKDGLHLDLSIHSAVDADGNIINFTVDKESYEDNIISPFSRNAQNLEQEFTAEAIEFMNLADESFAAATDVSFKDNVEYAKMSDSIKQRFREAADKITKDAIDEYRRLIELSDQPLAKDLIVNPNFFSGLDFYLTESTIFGKVNNAKEYFKIVDELQENSANEYFADYITTVNFEQMLGGKVHIYEIDGFDYAFPAEVLNKLIVQTNRDIKATKKPIELEVFFKYKNDKTAKEDMMKFKSSEIGYLVINAKNTNVRLDPGRPIAYIKPLDIMDSLRNQMVAVKNAIRTSTVQKINAKKQQMDAPNINAINQAEPFKGGEPNQKKYDTFWDGSFVGLDFIDAIVLNAALHGSNPIKFQIMSKPGSLKGQYLDKKIWVAIWKSAKLTDIRQQTRTAFHEIFHFEDHQARWGELDKFWSVDKELWKELKRYLPEAAGGGGGDQYSHYGLGFDIDAEILDAAIKKWGNYDFETVGNLGRGDIIGAIKKSKNYIATEFLDKEGNPVTFDLDLEIKLQKQAEELAKIEESKFEEEWNNMGLTVTAQTIVDIVNKTGARENTPPAVYEEFTKAPQHIKKRILVKAMKGLIDEYMEDVVDSVNDGIDEPFFDFTAEQQRIFAELLQQYMNEHGLIKKQVFMQEAMAISLAARPFPVHFIEVVKELTDAFGDLKPKLVEKLTADGKPVVWTAQEYMHLVDPQYWTDARIDKLRERTRLYKLSYERDKEVVIDGFKKKVSFDDLKAYYNNLSKYEVVWSSHLADFLRNYRGSTLEVYADVMSYMMVNPEQAAILGPNIVHLMEQHLSERPQFKEFFESVVTAINKGPEERYEQAYEVAGKESESQITKFGKKLKELYGGGIKAGFFNGESMLTAKVLFDDYMGGASLYVDNNVMRPPDIYGNQGIEFWNPLTGQYEDLNKAEYIQYLQDNIKNFDTVSDNFYGVFYNKHFQPLKQAMKNAGVNKGKVNAYITFKGIAENVYITGEHLTPYQIIKESGYTEEDFIEAFGKNIFTEDGKTQASLRSAENLAKYFEQTYPEIAQILNGIFGQNGFVKQFFVKHMATSQLFGANELDKMFANPWYITFMNFEYLIADMEAGNHPFRLSKAFKSKKGGSITMPFDPILTTIWKVQTLAMAEQENAYKLSLFSEKLFDGKYMAERADNPEDKKFYLARHGQKGLFADSNFMSVQNVDPDTGLPIQIDAEPGTIEYAMQMLRGQLVGPTYKDHYRTIELLAGDVFPWLSTVPKIVGDTAEILFGKAADVTNIKSLAKLGKEIKEVLDITGKPQGFWDITPESAHKKYGELLNNYRKQYEAADGDPYLIEIAQRTFKKYHQELLQKYMPAPTSKKGADFLHKDLVTGGPMIWRKQEVIGEETIVVGRITRQRYDELPKERRQILDEFDKKTGEPIYQEIRKKLIYEQPKKGEKLEVMYQQPNYTETIKGVVMDLGITNRAANSERLYLIVNDKMEFTTWKRGGQYNFALHPELQKAFLILAQFQKSIYTTLSPAFILPNQIIDLWTAGQNVKMNLIFPDIYTQEYEIAGVKFKLPKGFKDNSSSLVMYWIQSMKKSKNQIFTDELLNIEKGLFAEGIVLPRSKKDVGIVEVSKAVQESWGEEYLQLQKELDSIHELTPRLSKDDSLQQWREHPAHFLYESAKNIVNGQVNLAKFSELSTRQALYDGLIKERQMGLNNFSDKQIKQIVRRRIVDFKKQAPGMQQLEVKWPFLNVLKNIANAQNTAYDAYAYLGYNEKTGKYGQAFYNNHFIRTTVGLGMGLAVYEMLEDYEFLGERTALCKQYTKKWDRDNYLTLPHLLCNENNGQISVTYGKIPLNSTTKITKKFARVVFEPLFRQLRASLDGEDKDPTRFDYLKTRAEEKFSILANDLPSGTGPLSMIFDILGLVNPSHNPKSGLTGQNYVKNDLMMAAQNSEYTAWQDNQLIGHAGLGPAMRVLVGTDPYFELMRAKLAALSENYANPFHYDWDINNEGIASRNLDELYIGNFGLLAGITKRFVTKSYDNQAMFAASRKYKQDKATEQWKKKTLTTKFIQKGWDSLSDNEKAQFYVEFGERTSNKQGQIMYWKQFKNTASRTYMMMINANSQEEFYMLAKKFSQAQRGIVGNSAKENAVIDNAQNILISPKQKIRIKKKDE